MSATDNRVLSRALSRAQYTAEDLERLPADERLELIRGELCPMPNNSAEHGNKTARLSGPIIVFVEEYELGECFAAETRFTIETTPDTTLGPDFAFISKERLQNIPAKGYLKVAPDLVVETRSPNDTRTEYALKISQWLNAGTKIVWALDPANQTLTVHRRNTEPRTLDAEDTLDGEDALPGFSLALKRVFREVSTAK